MTEEKKQHVSIVICGHVDAGKSTTTGRLIFELGGIDKREMEKLEKEAATLGKSSFAFAFYMDRQKEERARGVTIACTTKEFFTDTKHYTVIDAPGHRDFIKNMITGSSQADVALLMVPADGNFTAATAKGDPKAGIVQGQTRQHSVLLNLLGIKQLIVCVNKMDCDLAQYKQERYVEIRDEMVGMLLKVGWDKNQVNDRVPVLPISGWLGDNLLRKSEKMPWWTGVTRKRLDGTDAHMHTLKDALELFVQIPARRSDQELRVPISGIFSASGIGQIYTGRVEEGVLKVGDDVEFLPTHTTANPCRGKVFSMEIHHKNLETAYQGDNIGCSVKNINKANPPHKGDIMCHVKRTRAVGRVKEFVAKVRVLNHPGELGVGYTPIAFVRICHAPCKISKIHWKIGKETGGKKVEDPLKIKANEMAEVTFVPQQPFVCEAFSDCEAMGRVAIMEGGTVVMLGKIDSCVFDLEALAAKK